MKHLILSLLLSTSALAAEPSTTEMRAALNASMQQTNSIRDMHIMSEAKAAVLAEENAKLKAELEALKKDKPDAK